MKTRLLSLVLICCLGMGDAALAQSSRKTKGKTTEKKAAAPKTPADAAVAEFNKARSAKNARTPAGFPAVISTGIAYLAQYPTHSQVNSVVSNLGTFGNNIDPKQPALRSSYVSLLKLEVANLRYKEGVTEPTVAALAALDAVIADFEVRQAPTREALSTLREKIDTLAETPGGARFLAERERTYAGLLAVTNQTARAEEQLKKLSKHPEKAVANMAREELNILNLKKAPYDLKFTGVDGKPVDFAQLRGKVVALYFWSTANATSTKEFERLKRTHSTYRKRGFEVVTVSYDKEEDRAKLMKYIKDSRIPFPVYFDGKGSKNGFSSKLNAYSVPRLMLFDQKGILQTTMQGSTLTASLPAAQLEPQVKKLLGVK